jgi:DnaJ-class molecular chaperone
MKPTKYKVRCFRCAGKGEIYIPPTITMEQLAHLETIKEEKTYCRLCNGTGYLPVFEEEGE